MNFEKFLRTPFLAEHLRTTASVHPCYRNAPNFLKAAFTLSNDSCVKKLISVTPTGITAFDPNPSFDVTPIF